MDIVSEQEIRVKLVFGGSGCIPEEITSSLGLEPTVVHRKGEPKIVGSPPRELSTSYEETAWILDAPDDQASVEEKIEWLMSKLSNKAEAVKHITEKCSAEISVVAHSGDANPGMHLSK